jgi:hypothetical protein
MSFVLSAFPLLVLGDNGVVGPLRAPLQATDQTALAECAVQVHAIAESHGLSRSKKEKHIATVVRTAVVAATAYQQSDPAALGLALAYASAAAQAAPQFAKVIAAAVSFTPAINHIDGASGQIETAIEAALRVPPSRHRPALVEQTPPPRTETVIASTASTNASMMNQSQAQSVIEATDSSTTVRRVPVDVSAVSLPNDDAPITEPTHKWTAPEIAVGDNAAVHLNATVSAKRDSNVFLTHANTVTDEIISFIPGAEFKFGQKSLTHGSIVAQEDFLRYAHRSAPNAQLGNGIADFGFGNDSLTVSSNVFFKELYQNNPDTAVLGQQVLYHSSVWGLGGSAETHLWTKTSLGVGANYSSTSYKTPGLSDSSYISYPLNVYYSITPKTDVYSGVTYQISKVDQTAREASDYYYHLGARGYFTPKLSGELSAGYSTRDLGGNQKNGMLGFNGSLNYELTPKTSSTLNVTRGFNTSALGESLTDTRYTLGVATTFSPQWQAGANISYYNIGYGTYFDPNAVNPLLRREDHYWQTSLDASYLYTTWLSLSADLTFRKNNSTLIDAEFSGNILSILLGLRY